MYGRESRWSSFIVTMSHHPNPQSNRQQVKFYYPSRDRTDYSCRQRTWEPVKRNRRECGLGSVSQLTRAFVPHFIVLPYPFLSATHRRGAHQAPSAMLRYHFGLVIFNCFWLTFSTYTMPPSSKETSVINKRYMPLPSCVNEHLSIPSI